MAKGVKTSTDISTEQKIKEAASKVFQKKGFAATRTRDIAEEAGLNLALLNYYFRSKQNLFDLIMAEKFSTFFMQLIPLLISEKSSIEEKAAVIADNYITLLQENPDLPLFVLNSIHTDPKKFVKMIKGVETIHNSPLLKQLKKANPKFKFEHLLMNIMGFCIFPFIMKPAIKIVLNHNDVSFNKLMEERKKLIPTWIEAMLKA